MGEKYEYQNTRVVDIVERVKGLKWNVWVM